MRRRNGQRAPYAFRASGKILNPCLTLASKLCVVLNVPFNREVTAGNAVVFADAPDVARAIEAAEADPPAMAELGERGRAHAASSYDWDDVARRYENVARELSSRA